MERMNAKTEVVKWRDSVSSGGWNYPNEMQEWRGQVITTLGFVIREDDFDLVMAQSEGRITDGSPTYCNWISIPKPCILDRKEIGLSDD